MREGHQLGAETEDLSGIGCGRRQTKLNIAVGPALGTSSGTELEPEGGYKGVRPGLVGQDLGFESQDLRVDRTKVVS